MTAKSSSSRKRVSEIAIEADRQILLMGSVDAEMHEKFSAELIDLVKESEKPVMVVLDSGGGEVFHGLGLYDAIRSAPVDVHVMARGHAMSMAAVILQAGKTRTATPHTQIMLHQIRYEVDASPLTEHESQAGTSRKLQVMLDKIITSRSRLTRDRLTKMTKPGDFYMCADEALELGLIDAITN